MERFGCQRQVFLFFFFGFFLAMITALLLNLTQTKENNPSGSSKLKDFLLYFKHIYEMEKNTTTITLKKWEPVLFSFKSLSAWP